MSKMFKIHVGLAILGLNYINGEKYILSTKKDKLVLPYMELDEDDNLEQVLTTISRTYVDLDANWLQFQLINLNTQLMIQDDTIVLLYRTMIPLDTKTMDSFWIQSWKSYDNPLTPFIVAL